MLVGLGAPGLLGNLLAAGSHCWVLTKESCTQVYALERKAPLASSVGTWRNLGGREAGLLYSWNAFLFPVTPEEL